MAGWTQRRPINVETPRLMMPRSLPLLVLVVSLLLAGCAGLKPPANGSSESPVSATPIPSPSPTETPTDSVATATPTKTPCPTRTPTQFERSDIRVQNDNTTEETVQIRVSHEGELHYHNETRLQPGDIRYLGEFVTEPGTYTLLASSDERSAVEDFRFSDSETADRVLIMVDVQEQGIFISSTHLDPVPCAFQALGYA
jgi:hypothetical protein